MNTRIICFSQTGNTLEIGKEIAGSRIEEVADWGCEYQGYPVLVTVMPRYGERRIHQMVV